MPTAFTHALTGAAISLAAPRKARGFKLALVLAAVAALPDLDVIAFRVGIPYEHPFGHRGFSHSLAFALLLAVALAPLLARGGASVSRRRLGLAVFLACASHGLLDAFTDDGLGVGFFVPFSGERYFFPWRPIRTSPLSPRAFFGAAGVRILANEVLWIWTPLGAAVGLVLVARRARRWRLRCSDTR